MPKQAYLSLLPVPIFILIGLIIYAQSFTVPFYLDDVVSIQNNSALDRLWDLRPIWAFWPTRFVTYVSFAINNLFHGHSLFGYHLINTLIHLANTLLLWRITLFTLKSPRLAHTRLGENAAPLAFFSGLIFLCHPIQTESITYIAQRATALSALFGLLSWYFYIRSTSLKKGPAKLFYVLSLLSVSIAMFSKENAIALPFIIWLYDKTFLSGHSSGDHRKGSTLILATLLWIPATLWVASSVEPWSLHLRSESPTLLSPLMYLSIQLHVILRYIGLCFVPVFQNFDHTVAVSAQLLSLDKIGPVVILAGIGTALFKGFDRHPFVSFGAALFFTGLLPESSIFPIKDVMFEHRLYLPMAGFAWVLTGALFMLFSRGPAKKYFWLIPVLIIAGYSYLTIERNKLWNDPVAFWTDTLERSPLRSRAYINRGVAHHENGRAGEALKDFEAVLAMSPSHRDAHYHRGVLREEAEDYLAALEDLNAAIERDPTFTKALLHRAAVHFKMGHQEKALADHNHLIELKPNLPEFYVERGNLYKDCGDHESSLRDYTKAIKIWPGYAEALNNRANIETILGRYESALKDYDKAIAADPNDPDYRSNRDRLLKKLGRSQS